MRGFSWTREREVSTCIIFRTPGALWKHVHLYLAALLDQGYLRTSQITVHTVVYSLWTSNNKAFQVKRVNFCHFSTVRLHGNSIFSPLKCHFLKTASGVEHIHNAPASVPCKRKKVDTFFLHICDNMDNTLMDKGRFCATTDYLELNSVVSGECAVKHFTIYRWKNGFGFLFKVSKVCV